MPIQKVCERCGTSFKAREREVSRRFCSRACVQAYESEHGRPAARKTPIEFGCKTCGKPFTMMQSYVTAYAKKFGRGPMYCSIPCSAAGRQADTMARSTFTCIQCGKENAMRRYQGTGRTVYYRQQKFCNRACKAAHQRSVALARFDDGDLKTFVARNGYLLISVPSLVTGKKHTVFQHRYVMEKHLGRALTKDETVHHVNGDRANNGLSNLELFSSRHGPGQRVADKIDFAIEMLDLYPEFAAARGRVLGHISALPAPAYPPAPP